MHDLRLLLSSYLFSVYAILYYLKVVNILLTADGF